MQGKVVGIIQTRMGSSRLPGKVLKPILNVPLLKHMMARLARCRALDEVVIATTEEPQDQVIIDFARENDYLYGIGPEEDVLGRYHKVALERKADHVVRLTSDCPLIDPEVTDRVVELHLQSEKNDLTSNVFFRSYPRGLDTEILTLPCLERVLSETDDPLYREHVTNYIHDFPEKFVVENVAMDEDLSHLRWTVDTEKDLEFVRRVYEVLYPKNPHFGYRDVLSYLNENPECMAINAEVPQTKIFRRKKGL